MNVGSRTRRTTRYWVEQQPRGLKGWIRWRSYRTAEEAQAHVRLLRPMTAEGVWRIARVTTTTATDYIHAPALALVQAAER